MFVGSAEYSAEPLKKIAEYLDSAESHFGRFGRGSVSAESHFGWFGRGSVSAESHFGKDSVQPNVILAGSVHH